MRGSGRAPAIQLSSIVQQSDTCKCFHRITCVDSKTFRGDGGGDERKDELLLNSVL